MNDYNLDDEERMNRPVEDTHDEEMHIEDTHVDEMHTETASNEESMQTHEQAPRSDFRAGEAFAWLRDDECDELQSRWDAIQLEFVDDPRASVERADALINDAFERIQQEFANRRSSLNEQWNNHQDVSTEDLRIALQSYRTFINRLLSL
jgi:hypothetical protein